MSNKGLKQQLLMNYGSYCMLCRKKLDKKDRTFHHIVPRCCGGEDSLENGSILCTDCHKYIHKFKYGDENFTNLTNLIINFKK